MTISEAFAQWRDEIRPHVVAQYGEDDVPALSESWNDFTDMLCKDRQLTDLQYHYCPAFDDDMPEDEDSEREYMLDALGVAISFKPSKPHADNADMWPADATHWRVTVSRGSSRMIVPFSMGPKAGSGPTREDVLYCLIRDWQAGEDLTTWEEYAVEMSLDADSRRAERLYKRMRAQSSRLEQLFSDISLYDLAEVFADF